MTTKVAAILLTAYLAILLFANAINVQNNGILVGFDLVTVAVLTAATILGGNGDGRA